MHGHDPPATSAGGDVRPGQVEAEIKVGSDRLIVTLWADRCSECGEVYYSAEDLRKIERLREDFARKIISPSSVGRVYRI